LLSLPMPHIMNIFNMFIYYLHNNYYIFQNMIAIYI
jgi:hypothetical protein